jgi:hypothetical protein
MDDPYASLKRWSQIIKHDGHIVITVPDFDLYEHTNWPSRFNGDHKHSFTLNVRTVDPCVISIFELVSHAVPNMEIIRAELIESTFDDVALGRIDQTQGRIAECAIELVLRK